MSDAKMAPCIGIDVSWRVTFVILAPLASSQSGAAWRLDDFEDGDSRAMPGLGWGLISDALQGGETRVSLAVVDGGPPKGSKKALRVSGTIAEKGFAGAWVALEGAARAVDVSAFTGIRLRVRGDGDVMVGVRGGMPFMNFMARETVQPEWTLVEIPWSALKAAGPGAKGELDPRDVRWLGVQAASGRIGGFAFEVDDVELYGAARPVVKDGPPFTVRVKAGSLAEIPATASWTTLAEDATGDGTRISLADATSLAVFEDSKSGLVWFRVGLVAAPNPSSFGVNLVLDLDGRQDNGAEWWGKNKAFRFDRLVTAWVNLRDGDMYEGMIGAADADAVFKGAMLDSRFGTPRVVVDEKGRALLLGVPKAVFGDATKISLVAAVGSSFIHNDDVPDTGAARFGR